MGMQILLQPTAKVILAACDALVEIEDFDKFLVATVRLVLLIILSRARTTDHLTLF